MSSFSWPSTGKLRKAINQDNRRQCYNSASSYSITRVLNSTWVVWRSKIFWNSSHSRSWEERRKVQRTSIISVFSTYSTAFSKKLGGAQLITKIYAPEHNLWTMYIVFISLQKAFCSPKLLPFDFWQLFSSETCVHHINRFVTRHRRQNQAFSFMKKRNKIECIAFCTDTKNKM